MIEAQRELANMLDDLGLPSMTVDNIRREFSSLMVAALQRLETSNDNQPRET